MTVIVRDPSPGWPLPRPRWQTLLLLALTIALGLASRRFGPQIPGFVAAYAGDVLWATAAYLGVTLLAPRVSLAVAAGLAGVIALGVEVSQLWKPAWLEAIRHTRLGGLVLGFDFVASDLLCYAVGVLLGVAVDAPRLRARSGRTGDTGFLRPRNLPGREPRVPG